MKKTNNIKGRIGEEKANACLKKNGYKILQRNYVNKIGEIDFVCKKKKVLIFVEVKARTTFAFGRPVEAVTPFKQGQIRKVAELYMLENKIKNAEVQFDVVEVFDDIVNLITNAF